MNQTGFITYVQFTHLILPHTHTGARVEALKRDIEDESTEPTNQIHQLAVRILDAEKELINKRSDLNKLLEQTGVSEKELFNSVTGGSKSLTP